MSLCRLLSLLALLPWSVPYAAEDDRSVVQYRAPAVNPAPRRIGGSTRGVPPSLPAVIALVPDHLGLTVHEQPTLYWYLSAATAARIEVAIIEPGVESPLLEVTVPGSAPGMQRIDLGTHGVNLRSGVEYEWSVALIADNAQRSRDVVSGGAIIRVDRPGDRSQSPATLASRGHWYDALMALDHAQGDARFAPEMRAQRAALLEQVGLNEVALFERSQ